MHPYQRLHFVFNFSIGSSSAVEIITMIILSIFLFFHELFRRSLPDA
jgi:hypothetical protein